jgi:cytochrome c peroxidase
MFSDPALSGSGQISCASCHSPSHAFGPPNALAVQKGGKDLQQYGIRAAPTLTYKQAIPQFTEHFRESDDEGDESIDNGPTGGLTWDGRIDRARDQALLPLLSPLEMANEDRVALAAKVEMRYGAALRDALGQSVGIGDDGLLDVAGKALEAYQQNYADFFPYTSKYDGFLAGKMRLNEQELRGLALFNDETKGNCANCHISTKAKDGTPPQFTDYGMIAIGVPRNPNIPANRDPRFFDLGLCGPERRDFSDRGSYCGLFKTPTLRNVATRRAFFHNGLVHDLREAVAFYTERDRKPEKWYRRHPDGSVAKFDDLPEAYHGNVNREQPFGGEPGEAPSLSDAEIDDIVAFLKTLTDGYMPKQ